MSHISVLTDQPLGGMKPMQAVNNGPVGVIIPSQNRNNFEEYKAARIPFARNHDASEWIDYGGEFAVDVYNLFPNFDADPTDPANYEFDVTDALVKFTQDTGTEVYYRLGSRIEHQAKKFRTVMPKDFQKWAVVCEHVIRHYNEGWANGFHYNLRYWEIWNEPDIDADGVPAEKKRTWSGTAQEYYEFYATVATHLKSRFPHLRIGGPGLAGNTGAWLDGFLSRLTRDGERVPLDFFSWHWYGTDPAKMTARAHTVREKLDAAGYIETESHLNEWNYVANWHDKWLDTVREIIGLRGASFVAACMCEGQKDPTIDMMMYYSVAPTTMNGIFDFYTCKPIHGYWAIHGFSDLFALGTHVGTVSDDPELYAVAARDENGNSAALVVYYPLGEGHGEKTVTVCFESTDVFPVAVHTVDSTHASTVTATHPSDRVTLTMTPNTFVLLKPAVSGQ